MNILGLSDIYVGSFTVANRCFIEEDAHPRRRYEFCSLEGGKGRRGEERGGGNTPTPTRIDCRHTYEHLKQFDYPGSHLRCLFAAIELCHTTEYRDTH